MTSSPASCGGLWSVRPRLEVGECLSSWVARVAHAHGLAPHKLLHSELNWRHNFYNSTDIDRRLDVGLAELFCLRTGVSREAIFEATLESYRGRLYKNYRHGGPQALLVSIGVHPKGPKRRNPFCPLCLADDIVPHFRKVWRVACIPLCVRHGVCLTDRCPRCDCAVNLLRRSDRDDLADIRVCRNCGFYLPDAKPGLSPSGVAGQILKDCILYMITALSDKSVVLPNGFVGKTWEYFSGIRALVRLFTCAHFQVRMILEERFRQHFPLWGKSSSQLCWNSRGDFEHLDSCERSEIICWVALLIKDWPEWFIAVVRSSPVSASEFLSSARGAPVWVRKVTRERLYKNVHYRRLSGSAKTT